MISDEFANLQKTILSLEEEKRCYEEQIEALTADNMKGKSRIANLTEEFESFKGTMDKGNDALVDLENSLSHLRNQHKEDEEAKRSLQDEIIKLSQDLNSSRRTVEELQSTISLYDQRIRTVQSESSSKEEDWMAKQTEYQTKCEEMQNEISDARASIANLEGNAFS